MYILYAPPKIFNYLPAKTALLTEEVLFTNNIAYCPKFYWKKFHMLQGCQDLTPRWMKKLRKKRILNRIVIIAKGGIGDSMWTMPVSRYLREQHPQAQIVVITENRNMPVWQGVPYANGCVPDEYWNYQNLIRIADEVYDFGGIATSLKKEMKIDPVEATFKHIELEPPKERKKLRPMLVVLREEGQAAQKLLNSKGIDITKDKIITIGIEASTPNRNYPITYTQTTTQNLINKGYKVVLLGEKKENEGIIIWSGNGTQQVLNLISKTSIRESMAIIALSDVFIGPNSALMVIATALEIPTIGLFGAFNPRARAKFYDKFTGLWGQAKCAPCNEHWTECREGDPAPCMKLILPSMVIKETEKLLQQYPRHPLEKAPIE